MKTILVKGWMPQSIGMPQEEVNEKSVHEWCIRAAKYSNEGHALWAYAECHADWSTLMDDDNIDEVTAFCNEAVRHIVNNDYDWLEEHFI